MKQSECAIRSTEEAKRFVDQCEEAFSKELDLTLEDVFSMTPVKTVALAGPTCSGKTTTAEKLTRRINRSGRHAVVLSFDEFFLDRSGRNNVNVEVPDYDSPAALDLDYLHTFMTRLNQGKPVLIPHYDFDVTSRVGYREFLPAERDIYVFEGIQAVYPEVTSQLGEGYRSIFISVMRDVYYGGVSLSRHEIRLLRRLVRDYRFRGATAEFTLFLWEGVRSNEEKNIYPNAKVSDVYINSYLPYEPFVLARHAIPILESVPETSRFRDEAEELIGKLSAFDCPYIEDSMIPENSVYREFIG